MMESIFLEMTLYKLIQAIFRFSTAQFKVFIVTASLSSYMHGNCIIYTCHQTSKHSYKLPAKGH